MEESESVVGGGTGNGGVGAGSKSARGLDAFKQRIIGLLEGAVISSFVGGVKDEGVGHAVSTSRVCF